MRMGKIREFLARRPAPGPDWPFELEELATAALMVECARVDGEFTEEERDAICRAVMEELVLDEETAGCLVRIAERREDEMWHDWLFTETIKTSFDEYEHLAVVGRLWEITLADGTIHPFEQRLITRVASELGIPKEAVDRRLTIALRRYTGPTGEPLGATGQSPH
jgi:uncharacterized tellurite resistance protein B-like protein